MCDDNERKGQREHTVIKKDDSLKNVASLGYRFINEFWEGNKWPYNTRTSVPFDAEYHDAIFSFMSM